ncbi:unnamed protein product, partial [Ectocarpus sp. 12 AP-2014]
QCSADAGGLGAAAIDLLRVVEIRLDRGTHDQCRAWRTVQVRDFQRGEGEVRRPGESVLLRLPG